MQSSFDINSFNNIKIGNLWDNYVKAYIDYISKTIGQNPAERIQQCLRQCEIGSIPVSDIKSYDPFAPIKIYHRDIPLITEKDQLRMKIWTDFYTVSYTDLKNSVHYITPINSELVLKEKEKDKSLSQSQESSDCIVEDNDVFSESSQDKITEISEITEIINIKSSILKKPNDTLFQAFLTNIIDNGTEAGDVNPIKLPLSYRVPSDYIFSGDIHNNEKMLTTWGLNIYDGACWEIALWLLQDSKASLLDKIRFSRKTTQFVSIMGNNSNSRNAYQYLSPLTISENTIPISVQKVCVTTNFTPHGPYDPTERSIVYPYDPNGLAFRTISNYYSFNQNTIRPELWNINAKHWNDFLPICGENTWFFGLSPLIRNIKGYSGFVTTLYNLMDANGGFYNSPLSHNELQNKQVYWSILSTDNVSIYGALSHMKLYLQNKSIDNIHNLLNDQSNRSESDSSTNYSDNIRTSDKYPYNNIIKGSSNKNSVDHSDIGVSLGQIATMMNGIIQYFDTIADTENFLFYQGKTWFSEKEKHGWKINIGGIKVDPNMPTGTSPFIVNSNDLNMPHNSKHSYIFSVNSQTWGICSLQPKIINKIFRDDSASLKMWNNLKQTCGRFDMNNKLQGFGYTNIKTTHDRGMGSIISSESTFGAMMACKVLKEYYGDLADRAPYSISSDLIEMEIFMYTANSGNMGDNHLLHISNNEAYFNHANMRAQTGFGSFSNPIPSITSTSWHIFYTKSFNPFVPKGNLLR
jgi:hypothetical protein